MIVIRENTNVRDKVIKIAHDSCIGCHVSVQNSYMRLKVVFYWPMMKRRVK
jgi:hypothetical protein